MTPKLAVLIQSLSEKNCQGTLSGDSCHPNHTIKAIPVCEFIIAKRNCSKPAIFQSETDAVCERLKCRGYSNWMLTRAKQRVSNIPRTNLLHSKFSNKNVSGVTNVSEKPYRTSSVTFSTTFSTQFRKISDIIKKNAFLSSIHTLRFSLYLMRDINVLQIVIK